MDRRAFLAGTAAAFTFGAPAVALGAQRKVYIITQRGRTDVEKGFLESLGGGFELVDRDVQFDLSRVPALIDEIKREKPALVYTYGTALTQAIAGEYDHPSKIGNIPHVFALVTDPYRSKIVWDFMHPDRNVTGVSHVASNADLVEKMRSLRPFSKMGIVYNGTDGGTRMAAETLFAFSRSSQRRFDVVAQPIESPVPTAIADKIRAVQSSGAEWLFFLPDSWLATHAKHAVSVANDLKLPTFTSTQAFLQGGAFGGYYAPYVDVGRLAGKKARLILDGTPVKKVPTERASHFVFAYSPDTSKALGITAKAPGLTAYLG